MSENHRPKRVLVCEDSRTFAAALARALEHGGEIDVVGVLTTAEAALTELQRLKPDLVTMDITLPGMTGLEAVEHIMATRPVPILVISSTVGTRESANVAAALAAGALDVLPKGEIDLRDPVSASAAELRRRVKLLSGARVIRHPRARLARPKGRSGTLRSVHAVGVCASTGGPQALAAMLRELPEGYPVPLLVVQHIAAGFTAGFARWLDGEIPLPVDTAGDGSALTRGVWIAPEGAHLMVTRDGTLSLDAATHGLHRPSGDVLLRSLARAAGAESAAVVLTGMGRDGAAGLESVRAAGGLTIAQDEESSAVYGMPKAAAESAELILPPGAIGARLAMLRPAGETP